MNRSSEKNPAKLIYFMCIVLGAILLFSADGLDEQYRAYVTIGGFVLLMYGLYKSTTSWVTENPHPKEKKDSIVFMEEDDDLNQKK
ncbi:hypothetical protein ACJD0Z_06115 [Flavobacteriaceae bacterium M23B6Z8]